MVNLAPLVLVIRSKTSHNAQHCLYSFAIAKSANCIGRSNGMATPAGHWPYSVDNDFTLWISLFESYARAVRISDDKLSDTQLFLLDDAAWVWKNPGRITTTWWRHSWNDLPHVMANKYSETTGAKIRCWMDLQVHSFTLQIVHTL